MATASVKLHNSLSPWSPRPARRADCSLRGVIERHWGVEKARETLRLMDESHTPVGTEVAQWESHTTDDTGTQPELTKVWPRMAVDHHSHEISLPASSAHAAPPVPPRRASLQRSIRARRSSAAAAVARYTLGRGRGGGSSRSSSRGSSSKSTSQSSSNCSSPRGISSALTRSRRPSSRVTNKGSTGVGPQSPTLAGEDADLLGSGLWKKRSIGAEAFRGLFPARAEASTAVREQEASRGGPARDTPLSSLPPARMKKEAGRWGWGAWF